MKDSQKFTPKYWVGHDKRTEDVYLFTASKGRDVAVVNMEEHFGEDWFLDESLDVILVEIRQVSGL